MSSLELSHVWKIYEGNVEAVRNASFYCADKEFIAILGPSGCGKSSTMRMIAGLEEISRGEIKFDDTCVNNLSPKDRNVALAFESYALYSPLTVRENLRFPLVSKKMAERDIKKRIDAFAVAFQLTDLLERKPANLSGGQSQRVSLVRALVRNPRILLLDEPLSHLDYRLRSSLRARIRHIHDEMAATTVYVTHDQEEAMFLADRIIVMNHAEIQQIGTADELWNQPVNTFVAGFLGDPAMNFIPSEVDVSGVAKTAAGNIPGFETLKGQKALLGIRPNHLSITDSTSEDGYFNGKIFVNEFHGEQCVVTVETEAGLLKTIADGHKDYQVGRSISLQVSEAHVHMFNNETGEALTQATELS